MEYTLAGQFLEACDCTVICPCWVDDDPVGGHCTGFILWEFQKDKVGRESTITDEDGTEHIVTGCKVVSVATHSGKRRGSTAPTTSVVYIDVSAQDGGTGLFHLLSQAFAAHPKKPAASGPLAELAEVSGTVVGTEHAEIELRDIGPGKKNGIWAVTVAQVHPPQRAGEGRTIAPPVIKATGRPRRFDEDDVQAPQPLALTHTALSYELQAQGQVIAQQGRELSINVGALPGGSLEVTGRSGMRGTFRYVHPAARKNAATTKAAHAPRKSLA
ncbi:DUF1326 domain-containing protein [Kocuria rosea]|uniref:DUF1326 domain-containing protein n=1 Tax=Kocuria rosea TaxID=1275 RepID=UPI003019100B